MEESIGAEESMVLSCYWVYWSIYMNKGGKQWGVDCYLNPGCLKLIITVSAAALHLSLIRRIYLEEIRGMQVA